MNIKIAIIDNDINYLERLSGVLQQYDELSVAVFTKIESFQQTMEFEDFQIVLFNPDISSQQLVFPQKVMPICLCTQESVNRGLYQNIPVVQRYQRISNIYKEVIKNYAGHVKDTEMDYFKAANTKIITVHSPIGGSGKTTLALSIAGKIQKAGKRVLFLSMEQYNSSSICCDIHEEGITSLVEALNANSSFELKLKGVIKQNAAGLIYIECFSRLVDYDDVKGEEIEKIISKIKMYDVCDYVVIDSGSTLDDVNKAVLRGADRIVLTQKSGELADAKLAMFDRQILVNELREKMCVVKNFVMQGTRGYELANVPVVGEVRGYGNLSYNDLLGCIEQENNIGNEIHQTEGSSVAGGVVDHSKHIIHIPEMNPFFPYEVQFTYNGETNSKWFMTPNDCVEVGGHSFYVAAEFDGKVVTQMSLNVAGTKVVVYPKAKTFKDNVGAESNQLYSLLPLEEKSLTVDLSGFTPAELTMVSAVDVFKGTRELNLNP